MKRVRVFSSEMEANLAAEYLRSQGIEAEVRGAKEYAGHVLGNDFGTYELISDSPEAGAVLKNLEKPLAEAPTPAEAGFYFKKAVVFAVFAAIFLPIVFNYGSLRNLMLYRSTEENPGRRTVRTAIVLLAQIPGIIIFALVVKSFFT